MPISPDQSFTEEQARAIFEEAARRQAARRTADTPGLSLAELQAIAEETGLDPELVAAAAAHVSRMPVPATRRRFWDVPDEVRLEGVIPGDVSDVVWEQMVSALRQTFGQSGRAGQVGRVREWATEHTPSKGIASAPVRVEAMPENGHTRVILTKSLVSHRRAAWGMGGVPPLVALLALAALAMSGGVALGPPLMLFIAFMVLGSALYLGANQIADRQYRKTGKTFEMLLDRFDLLALRGTAAPESQVDVRDPLLGGALDLPVGNEPSDRTSAARHRSRR